MRANRAYRRISVKKVDLEVVRDRALASGPATRIGLDIGKDEMVACVRWSDGRFERPWSIRNPFEIGEFVELVEDLRARSEGLTVGLESTGTYGDAVRQALTLRGITVERVSGKATADYKEIFDGVPSQHDGKDAAILAELTAYGKGVAWPFSEQSEMIQRIKHQVHRINAFRTEQVQWSGRLEGLLARHWPELSRLLKISSVTLLKLLAHYGSPAALAADGQAAERVKRWGRGMHGAEKIAAVIASAGATSGVPMNESEVQWVQEVAEKALSALREVRACEKTLSELAHAEPAMCGYVEAVGAVTLGVIWATVGDPRQYGSSGAFLKALGLNLKELSSGRRKGELAITKRGPSRARRWLYYWALRGVQRPELKAWYASFTRVGRGAVRDGRGEHRKMKAVVALMRKQCRGLWYAMTSSEAFAYEKLFPAEGKTRPVKRKRRRQRRASKSVGVESSE